MTKKTNLQICTQYIPRTWSHSISYSLSFTETRLGKSILSGWKYASGNGIHSLPVDVTIAGKGGWSFLRWTLVLQSPFQSKWWLPKDDSPEQRNRNAGNTNNRNCTGIQYIEHFSLKSYPTPPVVVCSFGDNSITEGEVSEAFQFAALHQLPIIFLVQDNNWGISVTAEEARSQDAYDFIAGFKGIERMRIDGTEFPESYLAMKMLSTMFVPKENQF